MAIYTKEAIWAAADELEAAGERPTQANIRRKLGGGSFTTISEAMKERRAQREAALAPRREPAPERVVTASQEFAVIVWDAAQDVVNGRLAAERDALEAARQEFEAEQQQAAEFADQLSADLEAATATVQGLMAKLEQTERGVAEATARAERAEATAAERQSHIDSLKTEHAAELARMATQLAEQQAALTKCQQEREALADKLTKAEATVDAVKGQVSGLQGLLAAAQERLERVTIERDEARSRADRAEATAQTVMKQHSELIVSIGKAKPEQAQATEGKPAAKRGAQTKNY